jgi:zinc protease
MNKFSFVWRNGVMLCALLICGSILGRAAEPASAPLKVPNLKYEKYTLPNGLEVILREDHRLPLVAVDLWYHVGPVNEKVGRTGFAHLFEHMMFEGSEHVGEKAHFKYLEGAGATGVNGTTSYDRTNYFETVPSNQVDLALWLESDRMGFLLETLDRAKLTNQRDVVRNERRQGEGRPYDMADEAVGHLLFSKEHPYYGNVIGSHADIEAARLLDVREFFHDFYTPNNASIAIVGDFDPAVVKEKVARFFGPIPRGPAVEKVNVETPAITTQKRETVTDTVQLPRLTVAWLTPEAFHAGDADADMFVDILGGGKVSRLYQKLVYETQMAQSAACFNQSLMLASMTQCEITARPGVKLEDLEAAFNKELEALRTQGPTQAELDRSRNQTLAGLIQGLQTLGGFGGVADMFDRYNQYVHDPGYLPKDVARYEALTPASVQKIGQQVFGTSQSVVVYCVPGKKVIDDVPRSPADTDATVKVSPPYAPEFETAQEWRKEAPKPGPEPKLHLPAPVSFTAANGMKVYLIESHGLPVMSASLVSLAGGEKNPTDKPGLAAFASRLLTEGTATRSSTQLADDIAQIGAFLGSNAGMDSASVSVNALSNKASEAMELLSDVALHPAFRSEEVERIRKQRLVAILQEADQPVASAQRVGVKAIYGNLPYGFRPVGTTESVKAITQGDLSSFWAAHYLPGDSALVFAGDITEAEAKRLTDKYFGGWKSSAASAAGAAMTQPAPPQRKIILVDKPGSPQTALLAFGLGASRNTPDYPAITEMNSVLGGLFSSRINMNLREKNGYTYGATSRFAYNRDGGPFFTGGQVRTDVTAPAARELFAELERIHTDPATPAELKLAKDFSLHSLPGRFETAGDQTAQMAELFVYGLPNDYFQKLPASFEAVTPEAVAKAAHDYIHPDNLILVAVGDRSKIEADLEKLNLGPIEVRDESGELVKK